MEDDSELGLGMTAEDFYSEYKAKRTGVINLALRLAAITIPSLFPPEMWQVGDSLPITNQSLNAFCINTLASKLMLGAFYPGLPFAKLAPKEEKMRLEAQEDPELMGAVKYALSRREVAHRERLETTPTRTVYVATMAQLLVAGNALVKWDRLDTPTVHTMHQYVTKREASGRPIVVVLEECVSEATAEPDVVEACRNHRLKKGLKELPKNKWDEDIKVYHCQKAVRKGDKLEWVYWQEVEGGYVVPETDAYLPYDVPILYPAGLKPDYGSDWWVPYCADYEGDLQAVENYESALQDGAAADAWTLLMVNPTGTTDIRDIEEAENLATVPGRPDDVQFLRAGKGGDLATTASQAEKSARRLGMAFLLNSALQRSGERVTAEEWRKLTQDLDTAMGGLYSVIANTVQRWFVLRFIYLHEHEEKSLAPLPEGLVSVSPVTGLDGIGRTSEEVALLEWGQAAQQMLTPQVFAQEVNAGEVLRRLGAAKSVNTDGMVKSPAQRQSDKNEAMQAAQQQALMDKGIGPIAKEGASVVAEMMRNQQGAQANA